MVGNATYSPPRKINDLPLTAGKVWTIDITENVTTKSIFDGVESLETIVTESSWT